MELKLLKFSAHWCVPCKMQGEELTNNPIDAEVQNIDADSDASNDLELIQKYKIRNIPTLILIDSKGEVKARFSGFTRSSEINETIAKLKE